MTPSATAAGTAALGTRTVTRMGYGAMQLAGPGVFGPPADRDRAVAVARRAVELGVDHVDTSDFYGPHVTNEILREALHPYDGLTLVTKVGARRDDEGAWLEALSADELRSAVHDNLRNLGVERLDVVNLRLHDTESSLAEPLGVLAELKAEGLIDQLGVSNVGGGQLLEARGITDVACVQNQYNLVQREDDALVDACAAAGIAYVPFFPLGGFSPLLEAGLDAVAERVGATPMQVALAWLLQRSPSILLIPGTSSPEHLEQNVAAADLTLAADDVAELDALAG
ncbi:aldo/keto reductase family oxidoreductase [Rhodococcus aerolatus]